MGLTDEYLKFSYSIFGGLLEPYTSGMTDLKNNLKKAGIRLTAAEFLSSILLAAFILPIFFLIPVSIILLLLNPFDDMTVPIVLFVDVFGLVVMFVLTVVGGYYYPYIIISSKNKRIDNILPFATTYMATMAGSGMPPQEIFKIMAKFAQYGDVTEEIEKIVRDIDVFGMDVTSALERASERAPSKKLKDLFWEMRDTITTGGDLKSLLQTKSRSYMKDYRRALDAFVEQLSMFVEMYITVVIVGSVFFVVMSAVMTVLGGGAILTIMQKIMLVMLPLAADGFIVLTMMMSPLTKSDSGWELSVLVVLTVIVIFFVLV